VPTYLKPWTARERSTATPGLIRRKLASASALSERLSLVQLWRPGRMETRLTQPLAASWYEGSRLLEPFALADSPPAKWNEILTRSSDGWFYVKPRWQDLVRWLVNGMAYEKSYHNLGGGGEQWAAKMLDGDFVQAKGGWGGRDGMWIRGTELARYMCFRLGVPQPRWRDSDVLDAAALVEVHSRAVSDARLAAATGRQGRDWTDSSHWNHFDVDLSRTAPGQGPLEVDEDFRARVDAFARDRRNELRPAEQKAIAASRAEAEAKDRAKKDRERQWRQASHENSMMAMRALGGLDEDAQD